MAPASSSTLGPMTFFSGSGSGRSAYSTGATCLLGISVAKFAPPPARCVDSDMVSLLCEVNRTG